MNKKASLSALFWVYGSRCHGSNYDPKMFSSNNVLSATYKYRVSRLASHEKLATRHIHHGGIPTGDMKKGKGAMRPQLTLPCFKV
jgi:hypothetical protein